MPFPGRDIFPKNEFTRRRRCNFRGAVLLAYAAVSRRETLLFDAYNLARVDSSLSSFFSETNFRSTCRVLANAIANRILFFRLFQVSAISSARSTVESMREYVALMKFRNAAIATSK